MKKWIFLLFTSMMTSGAFAADNNAVFDALFSTWTNGFNHKNLTVSCNLFSPKVTADYQGIPTKNYDSICNGFKKIFNEQRDYHYNYKIHNIYRSNELAVIRITWYLRTLENNKIISTTQDEGMDVFQLDENNHWKIINYLGYPVKN